MADILRLIEKMENAVPDYSGMTTNERLASAGLFGAFDAAVNARNKAKIVEILNSVEVPNASGCADTILANPVGYGVSKL